MSLFTVAGTSTLPKGGTKVRYANDMMRVKVLAKGGHDNIDLIELPTAMTKEEIIAYFIKIDFADGNVDKLAAINAEAAKRRVTAPTATPNVTVVPKQATVKAPAKAKQAAPSVNMADLENAPF